MLIVLQYITFRHFLNPLVGVTGNTSALSPMWQHFPCLEDCCHIILPSSVVQVTCTIGLPSNAYTILITFLWTLSIALWSHAKNWAQCSRWNSIKPDRVNIIPLVNITSLVCRHYKLLMQTTIMFAYSKFSLFHEMINFLNFGNRSSSSKFLREYIWKLDSSSWDDIKWEPVFIWHDSAPVTGLSLFLCSHSTLFWWVPQFLPQEIVVGHRVL